MRGRTLTETEAQEMRAEDRGHALALGFVPRGEVRGE